MISIKLELENYIAYSWQSWLAVQQGYNTSVFPLQIVGALLGAMVAWALIFGTGALRWRRWILVYLAVLWMFIGMSYFHRHLSVIDWTAKWAGWVFVAQGLALLVSSLILSTLPRELSQIRRGAVLANLILMLGGYSLLQWLQGLKLIELDWFGSGVVNTILITAAICLALPRKFLWLLVIPWSWSLRQFSISWPLDDITGMLPLPWLTLCVLIAIVDKPTSCKAMPR